MNFIAFDAEIAVEYPNAESLFFLLEIKISHTVPLSPPYTHKLFHTYLLRALLNRAKANLFQM